MKTTEQTAAILRATIRWSTGAAVAIAIPVAACILFPLLSSLPALALTGCLSLFIGLNIALPPLDPEDDWVRIFATAEEESPVMERTREAKASNAEEPQDSTEQIPSIEILPVHRRRSNGAPSGTWSVFHPSIQHDEKAHTITLDSRYSRSRHPHKRGTTSTVKTR